MPLQIIKSDITTLDCDIIVNPTDKYYSGSGGADYAIHKAAGAELDIACKNLPSINTGEVEYTKAFNLKNKYIIHTVGPIWHGGKNNEEMSLKSCYMNSLILAVKLKANSIAFPLIASGTFGFPKDKVLQIAIDTISDFFNISDYEIDVSICVIDKDAYTLSKENALKEYLGELEKPKSFIYENAKRKSADIFECSRSIILDDACEMQASYSCTAPNEESLESFLSGEGTDGFSVALLKLIDKKGMTDVECYKRANISKQTFWKIMNDKNYNPNKKTVISFAISLKLTLEETETLLKTVGYSFSHSNKFDLIIEFFIKNNVYDIYEINSALYKYDQVTLGC